MPTARLGPEGQKRTSELKMCTFKQKTQADFQTVFNAIEWPPHDVVSQVALSPE